MICDGDSPHMACAQNVNLTGERFSIATARERGEFYDLPDHQASEPAEEVLPIPLPMG